MWPFKNTPANITVSAIVPNPTKAVIVQRAKRDDGTVASATQIGAATLCVRDGWLCGDDSKGNTLVMVPASEVAIASIEEVKPNG